VQRGPGPRRKNPGQIFADFFVGKDLDPLTIVYESFHGSSAACGPRAIYDAARHDPRFEGFRHVWVIDDPDRVPADLLQADVEIVSRKSRRYPQLLATAGYLVNNSTFPLWYARREGQVYVNTWHGVPMKSMFRDEGGARAGHANSQRNFLLASHIVLPNRFTIDHLLGPAHVQSLCASTTWEIGTARLDRTIAARARWTPDPERRHVLLAPTWRGTLGRPISQVGDIEHMIEVLGDLDGPPVTVHVKAHNFNRDTLDALVDVTGNVSVECVDPRVDINDLMAEVDVVLTDYSSLLFDALAADIPTVLYVPDLDQYRRDRGLYVEPESLPAAVCHDDASLLTAISQMRRPSDFPDATVSSARALYYPHEDGAASGRVLDVMLGAPDAPAPVAARGRPIIAVLGGGWKRNGISSSALNLLRCIDPDRYDIVLFTDGQNLGSAAWPLLAKLPEHVMQIHRVGKEVFTADEAEVMARFTTEYALRDGDEALVVTAAEREVRRLFGDRHVHASIDFSGYNRLWSWFMAVLPADRRIIFQHNDLASERDLRFPSLSAVFAAYHRYDAIASVSEETRLVNLERLGGLYGDAASVAVRNTINVTDLREAANIELPEIMVDGVPQTILSSTEDSEPGVRTVKVTRRFEAGTTHFVTLGRCSGEKNHAMLLHAFARVVRTRPEARLSILGEGPLLTETRALRDELGLSDHVAIPGFAVMGITVLAHADCFVLPSLYEGQPMTILEALGIGKPVIVTGIAGSRSALTGGYGHIVESLDADDFADAMERFCAGELTFKSFDPDEYNRAAIEDFYSLIEGTR
jgi:CDP-glycerol glycerophosphotransferase